jgi:hypothetical protein
MKGKTMKPKTTWLAALAGVAVLASAVTVYAITFGEADNGRHPNVGAVMVKYISEEGEPVVTMYCSGSLIGPKAFLTGGHCTSLMECSMAAEATAMGNWHVTFSDDPFDESAWLPLAAVYTHPGYKPAKATDVEFIDAHGQGSINIEDVGVLILENPVNIEPVELPPVGFLDQLKRERALTRESEFLSVGYGSRSSHAPPGSVYVPHNREQVVSEYMNLNKRWLNLSMNPVLGNGGGGYGDSGGPKFWIDPDDGQEYLVAITSRGDPKLVARDVAYRIDTPAALNFINEVMEENP